MRSDVTDINGANFVGKHISTAGCADVMQLHAALSKGVHLLKCAGKQDNYGCVSLLVLSDFYRASS